jgi:hypothetical protein
MSRATIEYPATGGPIQDLRIGYAFIEVEIPMEVNGHKTTLDLTLPVDINPHGI